MALPSARKKQPNGDPRRNAAPRHDKTVIADAIRSIARDLRSPVAEVNGVTKAQLEVLQALHRKPALSINELADRTYTHQSSVSSVVGRLESGGLVTRIPVRHDARRVAVTLTRAGRSALKKAPASSEERLLAALNGLNGDELADLAGCLVKLSVLIEQSGG